MIERFVQNIKSLQLFSPNDTILVGVSGGIDSVVLIDLLYEAGYPFAVAHCNFQLRGAESTLDEKFVKQLATKYGKQFYGKSFETKKIASSKGISVEMAARDLRYSWFEEVRHHYHYDCIAVAHHLDDQAETFMLNLARGTGIAGLTGMKAVNGRVVRPLLFVTRQEINSYAAIRNLEYREDSTNSKTEFLRNKVRHLILPLMEELNPSFRLCLQSTISHLKDTYSIYYQAIEYARERVVRRKRGGAIELSIPELKLLNPLSTFLFEILRPYHFSGELVDEIVKSLDGQSGKQFLSPTHRAITDREVILIRKLPEANTQRYYLDKSCDHLDFPVALRIGSQTADGSLKLKTTANLALIDEDKLQFPLILRKWQKGDFFKPLGMKGMKKLSDFFVDEKFSLYDKENTWLLTNGEEIVWIVGIRLDDRYKVTVSTENVLVLELLY